MKEFIEIFRKDIIGWIIILALCLLSIIIPNIAIPLIVIISNVFWYQARSTAKLEEFMLIKRDYLLGILWNAKRLIVLDRDGYKCQSCGNTAKLEVHHMRGYNLIPNEPTSDLVTLCRTCHHSHHKLLGFPKTYRDYMKWDTKLLKLGETNK